MLTADELNVLPNSIVEIYDRYQQSVIEDIARRLARMDYSTAAWQVQRLSESSMLYEDILKKLVQVTGKSEIELRKIFKKAGVKAVRFDDEIYRRAGLKPVPLNQSPAMLEVMEIGLEKTGWTLRNLVNTTALAGQQAFIDAADLAYMQVSTGAFDYITAITNAVKSIADRGLEVIEYAGRKDQLDVAVRRAVLTGVSQTAAELTLERARQMGTTLFQTSAHIGARPTHEVWQGRVFRWNP